ncbi:hypothetical protein BIW11_12733 [Tropilaelaps mercedesae]|uniref:RRM domain-containing protein n=1 Tax=Tropilaelaps mercedesae TaxID=418985 RepID=A0A1V9X5M7_9ACAR|nr:hypothetical protein BIW11_12733 [Tropilaelaps mercedesae]
MIWRRLQVVVHQDRLRERDRDEDDEEEQPRGRSSRFQQERVISTRGGKPRQGIPDSLESVEIPTIGGHHHHHHRFPHHHQHQQQQQQQHGQNVGGQSNSSFQPRGGLRGRGGRFRHDRPRPYSTPRGGSRNPAEHHPRPRHQGPLLRFPPNVQPNNTSPTSNRGGGGPGGHSGHGGHTSPPGSLVPPPPIGGHPPAIIPANKPSQKIYVNKNFRPPPAPGPELTGYPPPIFDTSVPPPLISPAAHASGGYRERSRSPVYRSPPRYRSPPPRERDPVRFRERRDRSRTRSRSREREENWGSRDRQRDYHRDSSRLRDRFDSRAEHRYRDSRELGRSDYGPPRDKRETRQRSPLPSKEPTRPLGGVTKSTGQDVTSTGINGRRQKAAGDAGVAADQVVSKESKEDKQKRQVILTNVDDVLDERTIGTVFSKFEVERIRILRERKAAFVFLRNPRDAEVFCRRNPELLVGSHVLKVSYAVELAKKRHDGR